MFVKLFQQILDSSIADNRKLRHFFTDLLLCADGSGLVIMTPHAIARRIGADVDEVLWGLAELEKPDPMSKTVDHEGRRIEALDGHGYGWRILNYEHYRAMRDAEQLRESTRERVRRHRSKKASDIVVTPCNVTETECNVGNGGCNASNAMQKKMQIQKKEENPESRGDAAQSGGSQTQDEEDFWTSGLASKPPQPSASKTSRAWNPTPLQIQVSSWFGRRPTTVWDEREIRAWKALRMEDEDMEILNWFYTESGYQYLRRDLKALLNNWRGEVDKARNYQPDKEPARR